MKQFYQITGMLLTALHRIAGKARQQNYEVMNRIFMDEFLPDYQKFLQKLSEQAERLYGPDGGAGEAVFVNITGLLLQAQEQRDSVLLADYLELYMEPALVSVLELIRDSVKDVEETDYRSVNGKHFPDGPDGLKERSGFRYTVEQTQQGHLTVRAERGKETFYLHSNVNPWQEADCFAEAYADDTALEYAVLGLGLGYHAIGLWKRAAGAVPVHVYETDTEILRLAARYQNFAVCREQSFQIHYDPELTELTRKLKEEGVRLVIHYPSLRLLEKPELKKLFERFFLVDSSERNQYKYLAANFNHNIRAQAEPVEALADVWKGKDVYLIAAGPSLDQNVRELHRRKKDSIVLATGTVLRKLLSLDIRPDYVIVSDANERVIYQAGRVMDCRVPILLLSTANYRFTEEYRARRYLLFQKDFPPAEEYARRHDRILFETGGSVSTLALDAAIRLGAGRVIFLGLDLSFTNNLAHAAFTSNRVAPDPEELIPVRSFDGDTVYTNDKFNLYAEWIEKRLQQEDAARVRVINATEGGRYIRGMEYRKLSEILKEP